MEGINKTSQTSMQDLVLCFITNLMRVLILRCDSSIHMTRWRFTLIQASGLIFSAVPWTRRLLPISSEASHKLKSSHCRTLWVQVTITIMRMIARPLPLEAQTHRLYRWSCRRLSFLSRDWQARRMNGIIGGKGKMSENGPPSLL